MKLLIASDLHGSAPYAQKLAELYKAEQPEKIILLGDLLYHGPRNDLPAGYAPKEVIAILNSLSSHILAVRGNCEAEVDQMVLTFPVMADYALLYVDGNTIYATHGHHAGPQNPPGLAAPYYLLCGHTHIGTEQQYEGYVYLNPGSLALPKDGHHSYMIYENGSFTRKNLDGEVLGTWPQKK
ncbi:MAG: phosphodiesterase [Oscillospiraceae bacterium]